MILGMHRSGTSFLTNWLQRCGLYVGAELYGEDIGNRDGHFEDWNFIDLHRRALKEKPFEVQREDFDFEKHARYLVEVNNSSHKQWAWKDPRTCLLLDKWHMIIPDTSAIVIFRHYSFVVDSIMRRYKSQTEKKHFLVKAYRLIFLYWRKKRIYNFYLSEWIKYNQQILMYLKKKDRKDYLVVSLDILLQSSEAIIAYFNNLGFELSYTDPLTIFKPNLFAESISEKFDFRTDLEEKAKAIYSELVVLSRTNQFL